MREVRSEDGPQEDHGAERQRALRQHVVEVQPVALGRKAGRFGHVDEARQIPEGNGPRNSPAPGGHVGRLAKLS